MDNNRYAVKALEQIFHERDKFILIGLTGRTGSGCTTAATLLSYNVNDFDLPTPKLSCFDNNDERKERIIYSYTQKHWDKFTVISMRDVITSFVLENEYCEFESYIMKSIQVTKDKIEISQKMNNRLKDQYEIYHKERKDISNLDEYTKDQIKIKAQRSYDFYYKGIKSFSEDLKKCFDKINLKDSEDSFTSLFQKLGNNIRSSGNALKESYENENIYTFAKRLNKIVKVIRVVEENKSFIVIDAIRNPFEAQYLRERYSAFYLISINTPNSDRIERLTNLGYTKEKIESLDNNEYPKKLKGVYKFTRQDMQKCIELSDIHINNPHDQGQDLNKLKKQLAWYVSLIKHPALVTPTPLERTMQIAYQVKLNSGCISRQVGAVITDQYYSIKAVGWNSSAEAQTPCLLRSSSDLISILDKKGFSFYENTDEKFRDLVSINYKYLPEHEHFLGFTPCYCFKDLQNRIDGEKNQVHTRSLHAEENAFLQLAKYGGVGIIGGILFSTASPCELCAKKAYQLGIKKIFYIDPYPGISLDHIFQSGKKRPVVELFSGALGRAHHQLYTPIFPFKDEQELLYGDLIGTESILEDEIKKAEKNLKEKRDELDKVKKNIK